MEPSNILSQAYFTLCKRDPDMEKHFWLGVQVKSRYNQNAAFTSTINDYVKTWHSSAFYRCMSPEDNQDFFRLEDEAMTHLEEAIRNLNPTNIGFQGIHFCLFGQKRESSPWNIPVELCSEGERISPDVFVDCMQTGTLTSWLRRFLCRRDSLYRVIEEH